MVFLLDLSEAVREAVRSAREILVRLGATPFVDRLDRSTGVVRDRQMSSSIPREGLLEDAIA
jgi:hypothetical protein